MELGEVLTTLSTTAAGGAAVMLIAKMAIEKHIKSVDETARMLREVDRTLAVLQAHVEHRFTGVERDLNGLGALIRSMKERSP